MEASQNFPFFAPAQKVTFAPLQADEVDFFAAKVAQVQPVVRKVVKATSARGKAPKVNPWAASLSGAGPKRIAKRSAGAEREPESRSLS